MAIISGRVDSVIERVTNFGPMYALKVNGKTYGLGKAKGGVTEGDFVEFLAEENAKGFWDIQKGTIKPAAAPANAPKPMANAAPAASYGDARQDSIIYQSSRKDSIEFLKLLAEQGALDVGKLKGAEKMALFEAHLDRLTSHFIQEVKDGRPSPSQPPNAGNTAKAEATPADEFDDSLNF